MISQFIHRKAEEIRRLQERETDVQFSFLKMIGIFFVVYGHVGPGISLFAEDWFPQGPMKLPLFVFVSGYFYSLASDEKPFSFLFKRVKRLLIPYFVWNLIYGLLAFVLRACGWIHFGEQITLKSLFWDPWVHGHQFQFNIAAWFLPALFLVSTVFVLIRFCLKKLKILNEWVLLMVFFAASYGIILFAQADHNHGPMLILIRTVCFLPFFQLGLVYKTKLKHLNLPSFPFFGILFLLAAANVYFLKPTGAVTVWCVFTGSALGHLISVLLAIAFWTKVAELLAPAVRKMSLLCFIGENTFSIMLHHAFVIFVINSILFSVSQFGFVSSFDPKAYGDSVWYAVNLFEGKFLLFYIACGILIPCLGKQVWNRLLIKLDGRLPLPDSKKETCA